MICSQVEIHKPLRRKIILPNFLSLAFVFSLTVCQIEASSKNISSPATSTTTQKKQTPAELTHPESIAKKTIESPLDTARNFVRQFPELFLASGLLCAGLLAVVVQGIRRSRQLQEINHKFAIEILNGKSIQEKARQLNEELEKKCQELSALNQELAIARDAAQEASRLKSDFVANISHEIRTPISAVIGMNMLLLNTELDNKQKEYAGLANESAQSLLTIINDILDFSKIEAGKLEIHPSKFWLETVIKEILDMLSNAVAQKPLVLMSVFEPDLISTPLLGDPYRLRQVLINLAGNAIKFTQEGEIVLYGRKSVDAIAPNTVQFSVMDTGIGISVEAQNKLFRPFVQANRATSRKYGGTGLGLSISKRLVELMGGAINVESKEGAGARFNFTLPVWVDAIAEANTEPELKLSKHPAVLIVSRNLNYPAILSEYLQKLGYKVSISTDLDRAHLSSNESSVVIADFTVSEEIQRAIDHDMALKAVPIIMIRHSNTELLRNTTQVFYVNNLLMAQDIRKILESLSSPASMPAPDQTPIAEIIQTAEPVVVSSAVLVAEDSPVLQTVVRQLLEKLGCAVEIVGTGKEAVEASAKRHFNLILMDWQMPEMDGLEATRLIRASENLLGRHTPIIAMTANAMQGDKDRCIEAGMDGYLAKPFKLDELKAIVAQYKSHSDPEAQSAA